MKKTAATLHHYSKHSKIAATLLMQLGVGIGLIAGSLYTFLVLAEEVIKNEIISFDTTITHAIYAWRSPALTGFMNGITVLGSHVFLAAAMIAVILFLIKTQKKNAFLFSFILTFGVALNFLLKNLLHRPRPDFMPLIHEPSYSFPSAHAMNSFIFYACLSYFIFRKLLSKTLAWMHIIGAGIVVLLIGISRIYLGAHYPSDVVAGYAAGLLWFLMVLLLNKTLFLLKSIKN